MAVAFGATLAGCGDAQQAIGRAHLVNEMASRLDHASELTYTADYQLADGQRATIAQAQDPRRAAYTYPGGKFATTRDSTADCRLEAGGTTCTLTAPPSPSTETTFSLLSAVRERGLVPPTLVVGLLTSASLSPNTVIEQHDTTLAGEHATCISVSGVENSAASQFDACITSGGVLGSFKGLVDGKTLEVSLIRYVASVTDDAFDLPARARVVDQRPKAP
ncbi:hypothetical protein Pme01_37400 [Planosporangium mesophilum]|uniref:Uncharacterized protein n=1 Tax=Planosporangium mesophilum TaxID=689768 RepID=A0A8J3TCE7_9ACTN|nr:hypothetical protein Pme01_37400 [Planosporangium mesophilum]